MSWLNTENADSLQRMYAKRKSIRLIGCRHDPLILIVMKKYQKAQMIAKNLPTGSYAAGCPAEKEWAGHCSFLGMKNNFCNACERTK